MTESEKIKKSNRHCECMKNDAVVVLDSGFGTHHGESDLVYRNRKMYAELAIQALEKQVPKKVTDIHIDEYVCPACLSENSGCDEGVVTDRYCPNCGQKIEQEDGK